jgi:C4-dicarboxylate-specific signal transduction histidine kinase
LDLVDDALRLDESARTRHAVEIIRDYGTAQPELTVDRHQVLQVLINLLRNAQHACMDSPRLDKQVTVRVRDQDGTIKVSVVDNGVGIQPDNLTRIFSFGFTTRKDGHGFGLHNSANAARAMGGALEVHSDGPGHGACFTLTLPPKNPESLF